MDLLQLIVHILSMLMGMSPPSSSVAAYRSGRGVVICFVNPRRQYTVTVVDVGGRYVLPGQVAVSGRAERHGDKIVVPRGGLSRLYVELEHPVSEVVLWAEPKNLKLKVAEGYCPDE